MKKSFTLTEMIIVMALMAILFAISASSLSSYNGYSNKIECQRNLKYIGLAISNYANDYDQYYPDIDWNEKLKPYIKDDKKYICPETDYISYAYNSFLFPKNSPISISNVRDIYYTISICDTEENILSFGLPTNKTYISRDGVAISLPQCVGNTDLNGIYAGARHNNGINCLFVDSSVKWVSINNLNPAMIYWNIEP